jgi:UDP-glucose 4-epimerase
MGALIATSAYLDSQVVVTGGLGFIGSNLALRLVDAGARVTIVDSAAPGCGANRRNLAATRIRLIESDIGDAAQFKDDLRGADVIFNLAGEISHIHSMLDPERDAELNARAQLRVLEECARQTPGSRVVYASTRQIYGVPQYLPVDEAHPVRPVDFNGIHKYAATVYHELFSTMGRLDTVALCLTNVYGPRMALNIPCQGFLGTFLRKALLGQPIEIFGEGLQLRDPVYVDDVVEAFLVAGATPELRSRLYNVGGPEALSVAHIAGIMSVMAGAPPPVFRPFPDERRSIDIGSFWADSGLIRQHMGWQPQVSMNQGICESIAFYRRELEHYLDPADREPSCALEARR